MQNLLQGGSVSAGGTPLGTPPGNGFHSTAGLPRTGSAQGMQHAPQQQQQQGPSASSSFSFLGQVSGCLLADVVVWCPHTHVVIRCTVQQQCHAAQ